MHLADTLIQSSLPSIKDTHLILNLLWIKATTKRINKKYMYLIIKCVSRLL